MKAVLFTILIITCLTFGGLLFAHRAYAQGVSPIGFGSDLSPKISVDTTNDPYIVGNNNQLTNQPRFDVRELLTLQNLYNVLTVGATVIGLFFLVNLSSLTVVRIFGGLVVVATAALNLLIVGAEAARHSGCGGSIF